MRSLSGRFSNAAASGGGAFDFSFYPELFDQRADATDILAAEESTAKIRGATFQMLRDKAFRLALSDDPEHLQVACRIVQQIERSEKSAARNIDLGELRLKVARRVLRRLEEFETIRSNKSYSEERIVTMFADRLFDPLPTQ